MKLYRPTKTDLLFATELRDFASAVRKHAYAPYSKFRVGAAILTAKYNFYTGCNVESADYDGTHAEEAALAAMVAGGERSPVMLAVFGALDDAEEMFSAPPCGKCRQKLYEFSSLSGSDLRILVDDPKTRRLRVVLLSELLPSSFGPATIGVNLARYRR